MEERQEKDSRREEGGSEERKGRTERSPRFKKKTCRFCENKDLVIDYKRVDVLVKLVSNKGKILPRRLTGTCALHQRAVAKAIKKARNIGFMPFTV
jgi:small subunit ribosomal protein S18